MSIPYTTKPLPIGLNENFLTAKILNPPAGAVAARRVMRPDSCLLITIIFADGREEDRYAEVEDTGLKLLPFSLETRLTTPL